MNPGEFQSINPDPIKTNAQNPPWGTEPRETIQTPATATQERSKGFLRTTYMRDYLGASVTPALPQRISTTDYLQKGWPFERTHYQSTFRTPQQDGKNYSRYSGVPPLSSQRKNNPHPQLHDPWHYPDKTYLVWKNLAPGPTRQPWSAPPHILQNDKHRWLNTTYRSSYHNRPFTLPEYKVKDAWKSNGWRPDSKATRTPDLYHQTMYSHDYKGARGRPSTNERPWDMSWSNLGL